MKNVSFFFTSLINQIFKFKIKKELSLKHSPKYEYYKRFCESIDKEEWRVKKEDSSSYSINGENKAYVIINDKTGQQLWIASNFNSFKDYNYNRDYDLTSIDVFDDLKLLAWKKASSLINEAKEHNAKFLKIKDDLKARKIELLANKITSQHH